MRRLWLGVVVAVLVGIPALPYLYSPIYRFPSPQPFSGPVWYNPYASLSGSWHKVNFHAHTRSWAGLTDGRQSAAQVRDTYRALGYDIAAISNYQTIDATNAADAGYVPVYEHGYSLFKAHRLVIGARDVEWLDFPLGQTIHHRQYIIDRLRSSARLLAIAHPAMRHGHTVADFRMLGNYDLIEALHPHVDSLEEWDSALSSGHAVWILGSDDTHDVVRPQRLAVRWTEVNCQSNAPDAILPAMRIGRHVGFRGHRAERDNEVRAVAVEGNTLRVTLAHLANRLTFIGQDGRHLAATEHAASASYVVSPADTYVRVEVETPATTMYLNPVLRWDGQALPDPRPTLDVAATRALRCMIALSYVMVAGILVRRHRNH